jgi:hypothetical protein
MMMNAFDIRRDILERVAPSMESFNDGDILPSRVLRDQAGPLTVGFLYRTSREYVKRKVRLICWRIRHDDKEMMRSRDVEEVMKKIEAEK